MTNLGISKGILPYQQSGQVKTSSDNSPSMAFMQTLRQTGFTESDAVKTENRSIGSMHNADTAKTENPASKPNRNSDNETGNISDSSVSGGKIKVDEETAKELEQLKDAAQSENSTVKADGSDVNQNANVFSQINGKSDKSHLEQAEEALKNAILNAFDELKAPDKDLEEFEEKILDFLLKSVKKIYGKTDEDSAADSEKEGEEGLDAILVQAIENMLENARKNAEMSAQTAQTQLPLGTEDFPDVEATASQEVSDVSAIAAAGENERQTQPQQAVDTDKKTAALPTNIPLDPNKKPFDDVRTNLPTGLDYSDNPTPETSVSDHTGHVGQFETIHRGDVGLNPVVPPVHTQSVGIGAVLPESAPVISEENPESASLFNGTVMNHSAEDAALSFNETGDNSSLSSDYLGAIDEVTAGNQASFSDGEIKTSLSLVLPETTQAEASSETVGTVELPETENAVYEQLAENVYKEVEQTFRAAKETSVKPVAANNAEQNAETTENTAENEFDELTQLLDLKKNALSSENGKSDNPDNADNFAESGKNGEKDIFFSDIKLVSSKEIELPVLENAPTGGAVDRVVTQVVNRIMASIPQKGEETSLIVTLDPESLGKISIKLVENAGKISVTITAENRETAAMLSSRAENVQESMRDQGTQLEKYQVVCSAEQDSRSEQQNYEGSSKNPYVRNIDEDGDDDGEFEEILRGAV